MLMYSFNYVLIQIFRSLYTESKIHKTYGQMTLSLSSSSEMTVEHFIHVPTHVHSLFRDSPGFYKDCGKWKHPSRTLEETTSFMSPFS
jgi:hypothetical protein